MDLDDAYEDFEGQVRCYVCGSLLEIRTVEAKLKNIKVAHVPLKRSPNRDS